MVGDTSEGHGGGGGFLANEELQPVGLHFRDGARWTHQCCCNWMSENAFPRMTKRLSWCRTLLSQKCKRCCEALPKKKHIICRL